MTANGPQDDRDFVVTVTIIVMDIARSVAFYRDVLGATVVRQSPGASRAVFWYNKGPGGHPVMKDNLPHEHDNGTVHTHDNAYPGHTHEHSHEHRHHDGIVHAHPHTHDGSDLDHEHEHASAGDDAAT